jgi:DNA polymerase elongation subunit (family B)
MEYVFKLFEFNVYNDKGIDKDSDEDENEYGPKKDISRFVIQMFGINEKGEKASIIVEDYQPFFYLKVDNNWGQTKKNAFYNHLKTQVGKYYQDSITDCRLIERKKLYGFDAGKKHRFIEIKFANANIYNKVKNLWYKDTINEDGEKERKLLKNGYKFIYKDEVTYIELYEANIPPLLRFFHIREVSPSGWIAMPIKKTTQVTELNKTTSCDYEFIINYKNVIPLNYKEDSVPYKIMSFDIEASSSHGDFPVPIKSYKKLATNIVDYFSKLEDKSIDLNREECKKILNEIVRAAFGKNPMDNIDLVYPKEQLKDESDLQKRTENWLKTKVRDRKDVSNEEHLIESLFESANKAMQTKEKEEEKDKDNSDDDDSDNEENEIIEEKYYKIGSGLNYDQNYKNKESTIVDIMCDKKFGREGKISELIRSLRNNFPALEGDKVTFIGSTFMNYGDKEPYLNHCIVLNSCDNIMSSNSQIETYDTEKEVLQAWTKLVQRENPDIIIGYNIFSFDYEFMFRRSQELDCVEDFLKLSRNNDELCATVDYKNPGKIDIDRSSTTLASGTYELAIIKMNGRLQVDMLNWFRRTENLTSYKLDYVGSHFIGDEVKGILHKCRDEMDGLEVTRIMTNNMTGLQEESYIHFEEINHSSDYYKDGQKFKVIKVCKQEGWFEILGTENPYAKKVKWGLAKDDVTPKDIFRMTNEGPASRAIIAKYCIQDCNLVHYLFNKVDVVTDLVEMSKLCSVPMSFLIFRGQGIKLTSYVAKKCREKGVLIPVIDKGSKNDGYEGAIVLDPKCGLYLDEAVCVGDFASLYPSSMLSENLCPSSKVWTKIYDLAGNLVSETGEKDMDGIYIYDNLPEIEYVDVRFDTYRYIRKNPTAKAEKVKSGYKECRFAQPIIKEGVEEKAIMPSILQELLKARKDTRKLIPQTPDEFMKNVLDKRQLAYKVTANSLYGQLGAKTSTFYEPDIAASTTATGRLLLTFAKRVVEECYADANIETKYGLVNTNAEYVYGDSVANYTPVYIKVNDEVCILTIEQLAEKYGDNNWVKCIEPGKQEKEFCELNNVETWTEKGWTKLFRVIRHILAPHKQMMRVLTHTGCVDVTDDHSLVDKNGTEIKPNDIPIGTELLHKDLPLFDNKNIFITEQEAQIMGFFFGDGSCGAYNCISGKKSSWALNNASLLLLNEYQELCKFVYPELDWKIIDTIESSGVYKLIPCSNGNYGKICDFVNIYRLKMYSGIIKIIPLEILYSNENIQKAFWKGMYDADGDKDKNGYTRIDQKNQLSASLIYLLAKNLGYFVSINTRTDKQNIYRITLTKNKQRKNPIAIKKIHNIEYSGYVYDLTTENHHFAAGVGNMIVHNTDSVFFKFNLTDKETGEKIVGEKALELTIEIAQEACHQVSKVLKQPHDFEYEKTFMPFCLLSKKRYVSIKYEFDPTKGKRNEMGIVLKRRDNAPIVKDIYGGVIDILMKEKNIQKAIEYVHKCLQDLVDGNVPIEKLIITKSLSSFYKNPQSIAHKVLADRIGEREPGNKPTSGDRVPFVYFVYKFLKDAKSKKILQGDRIETPTFIIENKLQIDYSFYITNQIMKPLLQLFGLVLKDIWLSQKPPRRAKVTKLQEAINKIKAETDDEKKCDKKISKLKDKEVEELIFAKYLRDTNNKKDGNQNISRFFTSKNL